jgi:hypothetical protein
LHFETASAFLPYWSSVFWRGMMKNDRRRRNVSADARQGQILDDKTNYLAKKEPNKGIFFGIYYCNLRKKALYYEVQSGGKWRIVVRYTTNAERGGMG